MKRNSKTVNEKSDDSDLDEETDQLQNECQSLLKKHNDRKREKKEFEKRNPNEPTFDKEGNAIFELNSKKKVRISKFRGQVLIDFRDYW